MGAQPTLTVHIVREAAFEGVRDSLLRRVVRQALARHQVNGADVCIALVGDARMAQLHERHLGHAGPTDVLSFDLAEPEGGGNSGFVEAEVVVSFETAQRQAAARGHGVEAEVALYALHGVLHLLGYDDRRPSDAKRMHDVEDEILESVGLGRVFKGRVP